MIRSSGPMWPWAIIVLLVVMFLGAIRWNSDEFVAEPPATRGLVKSK